VSPYDFVPAGADLLRVADLTKVVIRADFDEPDIAKLHNLQPVSITWDGHPDRTWHGHVIHAPLAVTGTGARNVGECTMSVDDATGDLPADSHVTVVVTIAKHMHTLSIPREALHTEGSGRFVYKVIDGKLRKADVTVGLANVSRAEVTSGLTPSDVLALHPMHGDNLSDNLRITVVH
jgi:HlyD family secretion protein